MKFNIGYASYLVDALTYRPGYVKIFLKKHGHQQSIKFQQLNYSKSEWPINVYYIV